LPPIWSIPKEQEELHWKNYFAEQKKEWERRENRNFVQNWFYDTIRGLKTLIQAAFMSMFMILGPIVQIAIILEFGFDWFGIVGKYSTP